MRLSFRVHALARIADRKHHVFSGPKRSMKSGIVLIENHVGSFDCELSTRGHGITGIDCQIHDYLLNLTGVSANRCKAGIGDHHQVNVLADHAVEHFEVLGHHAVEIENPWSQHLLAAEGEKLVGQRRGAFGGAGDLLSGRA